VSPISSYFVSVAVPLKNDADILDAFAGEVMAVLEGNYQNYELVLVDDGSTDETARVVDDLLRRFPCIRYIRLSRSFGVETAILAGLDTVIGDVVVVLRPDADPPARIPEFAKLARDENCIVFGLQTRELSGSALYSLGRRLFARLVRSLLGIDLPWNASLFMAFTRQTLNAVIQIKDKSRALRIYGWVVGFNRRTLDYEPFSRRSQPRSKGVLEGIDRALSLIVTNSIQPLRLVTYLGLLASLVNVVYIGYVFMIWIFKQDRQPGWVTISLQLSSMFLLLFIILTVMSEYVGRLFAEMLDRPTYIVAEERISSVMVADQGRRNVVEQSK
jgi:glycosyltransferase involved in cell wall biosynthesis